MAEFSYIPIQPAFVPGDPELEKAMEVLAPFVEHAEVSFTVQGEIEFHHSGPAPKRIQCCACGAAVSQEWWKQAVQRCFEASRCVNLEVTMPCCGAKVSLNDLDYSKPAGFARVLLEVHDANRALEPAELRHLEHALGVKLRRI